MGTVPGAEDTEGLIRAPEADSAEHGNLPWANNHVSRCFQTHLELYLLPDTFR